MISGRARLQLVFFGLAAILAVGYGGVRFFDAAEIVRPPYEIEARFEFGGGIYRQADVELLGTRVGEVTAIEPGPAGTTRVVMDIDAGTKVPRALTASIGVKSAIGEQVVELTPRTAGGPYLRGGDVIPLEATRAPLRVENLLASLDSLLASVPSEDLRTVIDEAATAFGGTGPDLRRLIADTDTVTSSTLEHLDALTTLIRDGRTVLGTQSDLAPELARGLRETGALLTRVNGLSGDLAGTFSDGVRAASEVTSLLADLRPTLPAFLDALVAITEVAGGRLDALRKMIVLFPWALETGGQAARPCDKYNAKTGEPIWSTCHFDDLGRALYRAYFAVQLPEAPGNPPYLPCTKGYEETRKFLPDGTALDGGAPYDEAEEPNMNAGCRSLPTDPVQPNVRGPQNVR